ncbi:MAG: alginate lyase family protein [Chloroflexi bacterium]|nr:alginate lyase family protein [Chloroflexota bacterium]MCC6892354.1 alginate lyase family protein [Anaerolineae bacterium]
MPNFQHFGLYFTADHLHTAQKYADREPFQTAWAYLNAAPDDLVINGLRYRLSENQAAGEQTARTLLSGYGLDLNAYTSYFDALAAAVTLAHAAELVRDHSAFDFNIWATGYTALADSLQQPPEGSTIVEQVWLGFVNLVSGIVLEAEDRFEAGCETFRQTIAQIRPEGYLAAAVDGGDEASFQRQYWVVAALVCMAEAAAHAGVDLWGYNYRGISVTTAAAYVTYYYYYPTQWRWATIPEEPTKALFKTFGSFLEIVYHRARPHDLKLLLDEQRPLYNAALGGLTTLTHAHPAKERRGLFG